MKIVDVQVHVWAKSTPARPWIDGGASYAHRGDGDLLPEELLSEMDVAGVHKALLVSPTWEGNRNDLVLDAVDRWPDRFRAIGRFRLGAPNEEEMRSWGDDPRIVAGRTVFINNTSELIADESTNWIWETASDIGLPMMIYAPFKYREVLDVATRYPDLRIAICHLGLKTSLRDHDILHEIDQLLPLADRPNISVKVSSLPSFTSESYPFQFLHDPIRRVIDAFGAERAFWGSDLSRLRGTYSECKDLFLREMDFLSDDQRRLILGDALEGWLQSR
jgi:predicted TIM-barrel fold metal-dependent hydrolase